MTRFDVVIHRDPGSCFSVSVPRLPGCFSAGLTVPDALAATRDAIECHIEGMRADGEPMPPEPSLAQIRENPDYRGGWLDVVHVRMEDGDGSAG